MFNLVFTKYAKLLITKYFKVATIVLTLSLFGLCAYGVSQLKVEFKFIEFLNKGTYLREYYDIYMERFDDAGIDGDIYVAEKPEIHKYIKELHTMINE